MQGKEFLEFHPQSDPLCTVDFLSEQDRFFGRGQGRDEFNPALSLRKNTSGTSSPSCLSSSNDTTSEGLLISSQYAIAKGIITGPDQCP